MDGLDDFLSSRQKGILSAPVELSFSFPPHSVYCPLKFISLSLSSLTVSHIFLHVCQVAKGKREHYLMYLGIPGAEGMADCCFSNYSQIL